MESTATYGLHQHETLGVGDDLRRVKPLFEVLEECSTVTAERWLGAAENFLGTSTLVFDRRQATRKDGLANQGDRHAEIEGVDSSPLAGTLLTGGVEDLLNKWLAIIVGETEDISGDFNQEGVEDTIVPFGKLVSHLGVSHSEASLHDVVGLHRRQWSSKNTIVKWAHLANQLHITILNTVVDHFDVVTSTLVTDPVAAGLAVGFGCNALEDVLDVWPGLLVTTGHERRTITGTFFTTGHTSADESNALLGKVSGTAVGVGVVGVSTINDDIALFAERQQLLDEVVDGRASHDQKHHTAGLLELGDEFLDRVGTDNGFACGSC
jgi:hypothetical protein